MESIRGLLDSVKAIRHVTSDYALAKELQINKARISAYYARKETPNEFACLQIARALGKSYEEVSAIVRIEAEKDESRRQVWRDYYKSIGGLTASIFLCVTFILIQNLEHSNLDSMARNGDKTLFVLC